LTSSKNEVSILDVGCGDANFFEVLRNSGKPYNMLGIDTTESSIDKCAQKGFNAICMDLDQYISRFPDEKFDFVVSFHCLEHLTNPIDFLTKLLTLLKDGGVLFISTPFSPLTIEADWIDILNYPPHHMGRWNCSSYLEIAKKLSVNVEFYHPRNLNWFYDSVESFLISEYNVPVKNITNLRKSFLLKFLIKPHKFIYHIFRQLFRDKINNQRASNVILAKFYK
jgi:SAM-dependent methyltransferase